MSECEMLIGFGENQSRKVFCTVETEVAIKKQNIDEKILHHFKKRMLPSKKKLDLFEGYKDEDELIILDDNGQKKEKFLNPD